MTLERVRRCVGSVDQMHEHVDDGVLQTANCRRLPKKKVYKETTYNNESQRAHPSKQCVGCVYLSNGGNRKRARHGRVGARELGDTFQTDGVRIERHRRPETLRLTQQRLRALRFGIAQLVVDVIHFGLEFGPEVHLFNRLARQRHRVNSK
jgi:hypothetical protein